MENGGNNAKTYDLSERTARFGEDIIRFAKRIRVTVVSKPLIDQLVRAATSVGANYGEAADAISRKDYHHRVAICRKESKETKHWLRMLAVADDTLAEEARQCG